MKMNISLPVEIDIPDCVITEIRNKTIDDFMEKIDDDICNDCSKCGNGCRLLELREIAEQLKGGVGE